jgi:hypothetical protein
MTNDLPATASTPPETPAEEALPVRQRATAAETRLTPAERGLLSILTLIGGIRTAMEEGAHALMMFTVMKRSGEKGTGQRS